MPWFGPIWLFIVPKNKETVERLKKLRQRVQGYTEMFFEDWKNRWHKCFVSAWDYFEGENINIDKYIFLFS